MLKKLSVLVLLVLTNVTSSFAKITLPNVLGDHMVLQQKANAKLWGRATANRKISIKCGWSKDNFITAADSDGYWKISVPTPSYGGPYNIKISDGDELDIKNILIGDVWICSGQSNMEMPLAGWGKINNYQQEIAAANYPNIRLLRLEHMVSKIPLNDAKVAKGGWNACSSKTIPEFSAVAYFFAREVYQRTGIPIGMIQNSWSGVVAEAWVSGKSLKQMPDFVNEVNKIETVGNEDALKEFRTKLEQWRVQLNSKDAGLEDGKPIWLTALATKNWKDIKVPSKIEESTAAFNGVFWLSTIIDVPASWTGKAATLNLGQVDEEDITWINGAKIGETSGYKVERKYRVNAGVLKTGKNEIAVRVFDGAGDGGIYDDAKEIYLINEDNERIMLAGTWKYSVGIDMRQMSKPPVAPNSPNNPTLLYNAMVHPLSKYTIKGVIWYQGEGNSTRAHQYRRLFPKLIEDWRNTWKQGDFPFYFTQLANFRSVVKVPTPSDWAELREAQFKTLNLPNTGMAVTIDLGDSLDLHPKNKQDVGKRLALIALAKTYGKDVEFSGPLYQGFTVNKDVIEISFNHSNGLKAMGNDRLSGFEIAGDDQRFYWADAKIVGDKVVVRSQKVKRPIAVRYAWADNPVCNLTNTSNLPASPFRTGD